MRRHQNDECPNCTCLIGKLPPLARAQVRCETFPAAHAVCRAQALIHSVYVLCEGSATVMGCWEERVPLSTLQPGEILGANELIEGRRSWTHTVDTLTPCTFTTLDPEIFLTCLKDEGIAALVLLQTLRRARRVQRRLIDALSNGHGAAGAARLRQGL